MSKQTLTRYRAARGNTSLESAVSLTKALRWDIQSLGVRLAKAATDEEAIRKNRSKAKTQQQNKAELNSIILDMRRLLERIEDAVPLINLAITTSGVNLSTTLPSTVSPSRLLQASTFLTAGDTRYAMAPGHAVQIGPIFTLSMYMLFSGHAYRPHDEEGIRETTWKEAIHKARVKLLRVPLEKVYDLPSSEENELQRSINGVQPSIEAGSPDEIPSEGKAFEFGYQLLVIEDLEDDRVHTFEDDQPQPGPFDDVALAGIREALPIHEISKIFYADTGKILNIGTDGEANNPILLLKRDVNAVPPRRMMDRQTAEPDWYADDYHEDEEDQSHIDAQLHRESSVAPEDSPHNQSQLQTSRPWSLPPNLDPEWIAFEVYTEEPDSDEEEDDFPSEAKASSPPPSRPSNSRATSMEPSVTSAFSNLNLGSNTPTSSPMPSHNAQLIPTRSLQPPANPDSYPSAPTALPALRTSLSLLELLIRLTALQQFQQCSHLAITDELLNFFLSEAGSTGAGGDADTRRRVRRDARQRVGFDPYDESPVKRRGEAYLERHGQDGGSAYDGVSETPGSPLGDPRFSPRLARGWSEDPASPSPDVRASSARKGRPGVASSASSPGLASSPLMRKSAAQGPARPQAVKRESGATVGKSPLARSESDSTLGTSPGSAAQPALK